MNQLTKEEFAEAVLNARPDEPLHVDYHDAAAAFCLDEHPEQDLFVLLASAFGSRASNQRQYANAHRYLSALAEVVLDEAFDAGRSLKQAAQSDGV